MWLTQTILLFHRNLNHFALLRAVNPIIIRLFGWVRTVWPTPSYLLHIPRQHFPWMADSIAWLWTKRLLEANIRTRKKAREQNKHAHVGLVLLQNTNLHVMPSHAVCFFFPFLPFCFHPATLSNEHTTNTHKHDAAPFTTCTSKPSKFIYKNSKWKCTERQIEKKNALTTTTQPPMKWMYCYRSHIHSTISEGYHSANCFRQILLLSSIGKVLN